MALSRRRCSIALCRWRRSARGAAVGAWGRHGVQKYSAVDDLHLRVPFRVMNRITLLAVGLSCPLLGMSYGDSQAAVTQQSTVLSLFHVRSNCKLRLRAGDTVQKCSVEADPGRVVWTCPALPFVIKRPCPASVVIVLSFEARLSRR